nr:leucyl aminopeptidase family protein [Actinomycetota bacterium]
MGTGDGDIPALRTAGAALGRKVRGKAVNLTSLLAQSSEEVRAHAVSLVLGSYTWNLKSGTPAEIPTFSIATDEKTAVDEAAILAE